MFDMPSSLSNLLSQYGITSQAMPGGMQGPPIPGMVDKARGKLMGMFSGAGNKDANAGGLGNLSQASMIMGLLNAQKPQQQAPMMQPIMQAPFQSALQGNAVNSLFNMRGR